MITAKAMNEPFKAGPGIPCLAMRPREAASALGISERLLWDWTDKGIIPHIRLGKVILYPVDSLRDWLKQQVQKDADANSEK